MEEDLVNQFIMNVFIGKTTLAEIRLQSNSNHTTVILQNAVMFAMLLLLPFCHSVMLAFILPCFTYTVIIFYMSLDLFKIKNKRKRELVRTKNFAQLLNTSGFLWLTLPFS